MTTVDIRHRVGVAAPIDAVHSALTTVEGLSGWWTPDVRGEAAEGAKLEFYFGSPEPGAVMEVLEQSPTRVAWRCVQGPQDWVGTRIVFDLQPSPDETVVLFQHAGWREPVEFMSHCSTKWAQHLIEFKHGLEGGEAHPFPNEGKISTWS
jgi:uncharacterized protein YndB with AHSA1/START domain